MKINCIETDSGIEVSIYDAPTTPDGKPLRLKRKFPNMLSPKQREAVCIVLAKLYENPTLYHTIYNEYHTIYNEKTLVENGLIEKLKKDLSEELNDYQLFALDTIIPDICIPICLEKPDSPALHDECSYMDAPNSLNVAFFGNFGVGKTTLTKGILDFDDGYRFLLVDNGRTTLCQMQIRAFIEDESGNIHVGSDGRTVSREEYGFQNRIIVYSAEQAYSLAIVPALERAFQFYRETHSAQNFDWKTILKSFCQNEQFPLDSFFGSIPDSDNLEDDDGFYGKIVNVFMEEANKPDEDPPDFTQHKVLWDAFAKKYDRVLENIKEMLPDYSEVSFGKDIIISFKICYDDFAGNIDSYYQYFTDNKTTLKGNSLRVFVREIYLETSFSGKHFDSLDNGLVSLPSFKDENGLKFHSILLVDTVGVGHIKKSQSDSPNSDIDYMSHDVDENLKTLNKADVIVVLDRADRSMGEGVTSQFLTLDHYGLMDKVVLAYSHYNQFIKMDMEDDTDREDILLTLLLNNLKSMYPPVPPQSSDEISLKAKTIYDGLTSRNRQGVVFLKGLVPRGNSTPFKSDSHLARKKSTRRSNTENEPDMDPFDEKAKMLNSGFENSNECLIDLMNKIVGRYEACQKLKEDVKQAKVSIQSNYFKPTFQRIYTNQVFNRLPESYALYQGSLYLSNPPAYNTTGALCRNASNGNPIHKGNSMCLTPVADFRMMSQELISDFLDETITQALEINIDKPQNLENEPQFDETKLTEFLKKTIKNSASGIIYDFANNIMVLAEKDHWQKLAEDFGPGVKRRRANNIYALLTTISQDETLQQGIMDIVMECISDTIEEYTQNSDCVK